MSKKTKQKFGRGAKETANANKLKAFQLRRAGYNFRAIAAELEISASTAYRYVKGQLDKVRQDTWLEAQNAITLESERLDRLQVSYWNKAVNQGNIRAGMMVLKIMERRAKLLGLDAGDRARLHSNNAIEQMIANLRFLMSKEQSLTKRKQAVGVA